jgi:hypothetical protein
MLLRAFKIFCGLPLRKPQPPLGHSRHQKTMGRFWAGRFTEQLSCHICTVKFEGPGFLDHVFKRYLFGLARQYLFWFSMLFAFSVL